jgi:hypothetical protein
VGEDAGLGACMLHHCFIAPTHTGAWVHAAPHADAWGGAGRSCGKACCTMAPLHQPTQTHGLVQHPTQTHRVAFRATVARTGSGCQYSQAIPFQAHSLTCCNIQCRLLPPCWVSVPDWPAKQTAATDVVARPPCGCRHTPASSKRPPV